MSQLWGKPWITRNTKTSATKSDARTRSIFLFLKRIWGKAALPKKQYDVIWITQIFSSMNFSSLRTPFRWIQVRPGWIHSSGISLSESVCGLHRPTSRALQPASRSFINQWWIIIRWMQVITGSSRSSAKPTEKQSDALLKTTLTSNRTQGIIGYS